VGSFIDTRPWSSRWFESPDSRSGKRPPVAHIVGSPMRHVHSLLCYESPAHLASTQRPSLLLAACYLLGRVSRSAFPVAIGDISADAFPGEYRRCTLTTPSLNGGRVKLRFPYSPIAAEIANSSANQWNRGLRGSSLIKIARNPISTKHRRNHV
jgi:hypothetical protein